MLTGNVPFTGENQVAVAMKHVREELPDLQRLRPEISSALAAVVDRATAKDLGHRYADDAELIADLEDVLAIETARAGQATGEATAILRTLPERSRARLPLRMRVNSKLVLALTLVAVAVAAGVLLLAADRTTRGTGSSPDTQEPPGTTAVSLKRGAANDYDPIGGDGEHSAEATAVVDRDRNSTWSTENYEGGVLNKDGVGIYVDAKPSVAAVSMEIRSTTPGWKGDVYVAKSVPDSIDGWTRVGSIAEAERRTTVDLDTGGQPYRYYLVWITGLPEGKGSAEISEIELFQKSG
jgi:serine/threonine-protein kinase